jgi:hypothetical protein
MIMLRQIMTTAAIALFAVACARSAGGAKGGAGVVRRDSIHVDAVNENYYEARIHAVYTGGQRRSLGTIAGNGGRIRTALAWEPRSLVFEIVFVTDGAAYVSLPVDVAAGESVEVRVPMNISGSGFFRRMRRD